MDVSCIDPLDLMVSPAQRGSSEFDTLQTMDFNSNYFDRNCYPNPPPPNPQLATFAGPYVNMQPGDIHLLGFGQENLDQSYPPMEFPCMYPPLRTYAEDSLTRFQMLMIKAISRKDFRLTR
jgi:hypothetical protein